MPSWISFCSSNLLLSLQGVQQPYEDPSVDSSSNIQNSKSSLLLCACLHNVSMPTWQSIFPFHLLNSHLVELSESSVILFLPELLNISLPLCTPCTCSMPTWKSFTELLRASVYNCVSPTQPCLQGIQQP
jgi:hypothetical protein